MSDPKTFDALSAIVFVVGLYEGLIAFIAKLFDAEPALSVPSRMDAPAWWIVAGLVLLVAIVLLERIDRAKRARGARVTRTATSAAPARARRA